MKKHGLIPFRSGWLLPWMWSFHSLPSHAQTATNLSGSLPAPATNVVPTAAEFIRALERQTGMSFGLNRIPVLTIDFLGIPLWQYLAALIFIFLAFNLSKLFEWLVGSRVRTWAAGKNTKFSNTLQDIVHGPLKVAAFVALLHIGLQVFTWPSWISVWVGRGLQVLVAWSITLVALKSIDLLVGYWRQRGTARDDRMFNDQLLPLVSTTLKIFAVVIAVLFTCQNALNLNITAMLASLSIGGLALGLAAQDTVANLFGAVAVFMDKPFRVGDRIKIDAIDGVVESIGLRSTRVRNGDGFLITIPNKTMGNATITNVTRRRGIKTEINFGITYDTPAEKVKAALDLLTSIYRQHPMTQDLLVSFNRFADSALNINVVHWWGSTDDRAYVQGMQELNLLVKQRFDEAQIEFAYPTRTVMVKQDFDLSSITPEAGRIASADSSRLANQSKNPLASDPPTNSTQGSVG